MTDEIVTITEPLFKERRQQLEALPAEQGGIGVVAENGQAGVAGGINKSIGKKGCFFQADGSWMSRTGGRVAAWIGWRGKR
jgi:hypothetical protein